MNYKSEAHTLETAPPSSPTPKPWHKTTMVERLRESLNDLMVVEVVKLLSTAEMPFVQFDGALVAGDQEDIFEEIARRFESLGYTPVLTQGDTTITLQALPHIIEQKHWKAWLNIVLFILTTLSVLFIGTLQEIGGLPQNLSDWLKGAPFMLTLLGVLIAHEFSHYFVGQRYGSPLSLPYFIPMPLSIIGTMGAVIVQRGPMRSRKALFDIGIAGPLGGLIVAIPLLFIGLRFTEVGHPFMFMDITPDAEIELMQEGNSLLYLAAKYVIHGKILPNRATGEDVWLSAPSKGGPVVFAAWAGLLVTAMNLFPIGQLDGGHIAYAMWGRNAWKVARGFVWLVFGWGLFLLAVGNNAGITWLVWGGLGTLMGPHHPPPLNDLTPLDPKRRMLGWIMGGIFLLILIPVPIVTTVF